MIFRDRQEAGRLLAEKLSFLKGQKNLLVLAIPRGGVVVGSEVAKALGAPLDVYITRKIGAPYNPELAIGAIASDGTLILDRSLASRLGASQEYIEAQSAREREEIERRMRRYRGDRPSPDLKGKRVILVDDGIATGATIEATIDALQKTGLEELILAVPVGPRDTIGRLESKVDRLICLHSPEIFWAVGSFYMAFGQTTDEEVIALLEGSHL
jgi:putative phosphoribosyl transferase